MQYEIKLTEEAETEFNALPLWLQGLVETHLALLALSPISQSRSVVSPPYPPGGMMSEFDSGPIDGTLHHVAVFFRFSVDETTLIVFAIGHIPFGG